MVQVQTGRELETAEKCRNQIIKPGEDVFVVLAERMRQIGREWELRQSVIFKSYIFVETADIDSFRLRLSKIEAMTKVLSTGEEVTPIRPEEEEFLKRLGGKEHIARYSQGYMVGDKLVVTEGALQGCGGRCKWIDRHRRIAVIEIELMGRVVDVKLGLGVVKKIKETNQEAAKCSGRPERPAGRGGHTVMPSGDWSREQKKL